MKPPATVTSEATVKPPATELNAAQYDQAYPAGIGQNYWHLARNAILFRELSRNASAATTVLDIGCGSGIVVQYLRERGMTAYGADLGGPTPASPSLEELLFLEKDAFELKASFRDSVTTILLMDVLEHLPHPEQFLASCHLAFPHATRVIVTLPARPELWSNYDDHFGHYRRYTLESVTELAAATPYRLVKRGYFFHALYFAALALKFITNRRSTNLRAPRLLWLHRLLGLAFTAERSLVPSTLPGTSIFAVLER